MVTSFNITMASGNDVWLASGGLAAVCFLSFPRAGMGDYLT